MPAAVLLCWLPAAAALTAQTEAVLTAAPAARASGKRNQMMEARLSVRLKPGYHVNSHTPSEDYLIPLQLTWDAKPLETAAVLFPRPHLEKYNFADKPLSVFTGDFEIVTRFQVPANAPTGMGIALGKLRYQACSTTLCLPPRTTEVRLTFDIR